MAKKQLASATEQLESCDECGESRDPLYGDTNDRECYRCRSTKGRVASLVEAIKVNGTNPERIPEWPAIRSELRKHFDPNLSDAEYLACLLDLLLPENRGDRESMLRMPMAEVVTLLKKTDTADTKTDTGKKLPENTEITDTARYIREQRKLIATGNRPKAFQKALIEDKWPDDPKKCKAMGRELQPSRYGHLLDF